MQTKNNLKFFKIGMIIILVATALVVATFYDLEISKFMYNANSGFGKFFSVYGQLTSFLPLPFIFAVWFVKFLRKKTIWNLVFAALLFLIVVASWFIILNKFVFLQKEVWWKILLISFVVSAITMFCLLKLPQKQILKLSNMALWLLLLILLTALITRGIKLVWGRVRFRDLENLTLFTPWYLPKGFTKNYSFVSGHASSSAIMFFLLWLPMYYSKTKKLKPLFLVLAFVWVVVVSYSRIVIGAHYFSDVICGVLVTVGVLTALNKIRKSLEKKH